MQSQSNAVIPMPGTDIVPDGWADDYVWPWLQQRDSADGFQSDAARLAGLEAAYKLIDADTLEIVKARRYLEVRWGELLGPGKAGPQPESSPASDDSLARMDKYRFRQLAEGGDRVVEAIRTAIDAEQISRAQLLRTATGAHVGHNSGENEWYTPEEYIAAARSVLGEIDLDPASSDEANRVVRADRIYTVTDNGLSAPWYGRVWMNPPYAQPAIQQFCQKLIEQVEARLVTEAIALTNNGTETAWGQALLAASSLVCFPASRIKFWSPDKSSATPLQGQMVTYFGPNADVFKAEFSKFGVVR